MYYGTYINLSKVHISQKKASSSDREFPKSSFYLILLVGIISKFEEKHEKSLLHKNIKCVLLPFIALSQYYSKIGSMKHHCNDSNTGNAISALVVYHNETENEYIKTFSSISLSFQQQIFFSFILVKCSQVQQADHFNFSH